MTLLDLSRAATAETARLVSAGDVKAILADGAELALIDLREELTFSQGHLLHARSVPLSRLELRIGRLVPRRATRIVLCGAEDGHAERAAEVLAGSGYTNLAILKGGIAAWASAGFELFSGVNVPSKSFGEFVEHESGTPNIGPDELARLIREHADIVVLDSRPFDEYQRVSIPTAISVPGAELVLRVHDIAPSPQTMIVVNCAGRTRSIIGAQSLINAGVPNKVVALRNGTMGWSLAGLACENGRDHQAPRVSESGLSWAKSASGNVARQYGVERIDSETFRRWRGEDRTLYLLDVRDPAEYEAGHVGGAISAPGGQLVQATDQYVGTLGARIVLVDDKEVRAVMTASWLRQMGWRDVYVLVESGTETGFPAAPVIGAGAAPELAIDASSLAGLLARNAATVVDLSLSRDYRRGHIPNAWWAIRSRLALGLANIPIRGPLVLTSEDGVLAGLAAPEVSRLTTSTVRYLTGGNEEWRAGGHPFSAADGRMADEPLDLWLKPYERPGGGAAAMAEYLSWETNLLAAIARDGTCAFARFGSENGLRANHGSSS